MVQHLQLESTTLHIADTVDDKSASLPSSDAQIPSASVLAVATLLILHHSYHLDRVGSDDWRFEANDSWI